MHTLHARQGHLGWDRDLEPAVRVEPGAEVELELRDCFDGQLPARARPQDVAALDLRRANPLTGPIHVEGAVPGDTLEVQVLAVSPGTVGWTACIPGFGLLADDFPDPHVVVSEVRDGGVEVGDGLAHLPTTPFLGTVGLAPAAPGPHTAIPPRRVGGNLDCRDVRPGATLLLPVEVEGALLSAGDAHAAQGDGEVCGTAVETAARATLRLSVRRDLRVDAPQLRLPREGSFPVGERYVTTGIGPDLHEGARAATRAMIEYLGATYGLAPPDAYVLCSIVGDLRIAEVVDAPNWVVAMEFDRAVLDRPGGG